MVSEEDRKQPEFPDDARLDDELGAGESAPVDPADEDVQTSLRRVIGVLKQAVVGRADIAGWFASLLPLIAAVQSLAMTSGKLLWRARKLAGDGGDARVLDDEALAELRAQFDELVEAFPEATAFFFGIDNVDTVVGEVLADTDARAVVVRFGRVVEARMNQMLGQLVDWGLEDGAPDLSVERLEAFLRGLEKLMQEVLDRWVLPRLYGNFDE